MEIVRIRKSEKMASGSSSVVDHVPHHGKVKDSSLATGKKSLQVITCMISLKATTL
jgi:hypothetical protein